MLLVHPGGPFWSRRDEGAWSIPKGEIATGEEALAGARREFEEELGVKPPEAPLTSLGSLRQAGGKVVEAWTAPAILDVTEVRSGMFEMEWPPRSGRMQSFPEVDRAEWFDLEAARRKLLRSQHPFLDRLAALLAQSAGGAR